MIYKTRNKPTEMFVLKILQARMNLSEKSVNYLNSLEKGFAGEQFFDLQLESLSNECLILNDLLLEINNTLFQIDTLIITQKKIYICEVKNYEGDFYLEGDRLYTYTGTEIKSPLLQISRSESLLRQLLHDLGINLPIESHLIFINPEFHLYQAPLEAPIIFPSQLNRFFDKLDKQPSKLIDKHYKLAKK